MTFESLEIIAIIIIAFSMVKLSVVLVSPNAWLNFARKIYVKPQLTSALALAFSAVVLYFLIGSGVTIVEILAVWLFVALISVAGMSNYASDIIDWAMKRDVRDWLREQWHITLVWIGLMVWGIVAIFFS